jgi:hypothetical protein
MTEQEAMDRWLIENGDAVNAEFRLDIEQLDRGGVVPEDELDAYLTTLKGKS